MSQEVIIAGGGVIGMAVARELAADRPVVLLERGLPGREASWAAAGMLCPHGESDDDDPLFRFGREGLGMYREYCGALEAETGVEVGYRDDGTFVLASSEGDWRALEKRHRWQEAQGLGTTLVGGESVRAEVPSLTLPVRGALWCPDDHQVHPRRLLEALRRSLAIRGARIVSGAPVRSVLAEAGRVVGVEAAGRLWRAPTVVIAAGAWSSGIAGLDPPVEVRPRKGQILALGARSPGLRHVVRWRQHYLLPRAGGELVVGATNENSGFDRSLTASGVGELLAAAVRIAGDVGQHRLLSAWTGFRPEIPDGLPLIGAAALGGLFYAFGHYRNGILHAPLTAHLLGAAVRGGSAGPPRYAPFDPMRLAGSGERAP